MFEKFSDAARRVVVYAQEEAGDFGHNHVDTEHLLLGLLRFHEMDNQSGGKFARSPGLTATVDEFHLTLVDLRVATENRVAKGRMRARGHLPFTPRAKKVIGLSFKESLNAPGAIITPDHILLGLIREGIDPLTSEGGHAAQILKELGVDLEKQWLTVKTILLHGSAPDHEVAEQDAGPLNELQEQPADTGAAYRFYVDRALTSDEIELLNTLIKLIASS